MKNKIITIAIFSIILTSALSAQDVLKNRMGVPAERIAENLIVEFDYDNSTALNELELSGAIAYLSSAHPILTNFLDYTGDRSDRNAPPKVAVNLVDGFDSNSDVQLTEVELSLAISYLRKLNRNNGSFFAMAD